MLRKALIRKPGGFVAKDMNGKLRSAPEAEAVGVPTALDGQCVKITVWRSTILSWPSSGTPLKIAL
jgi:hypothetical protein